MASLTLATTNEASNFAEDGTGFFENGFTLLDFCYSHVFLAFTAVAQRSKPMSEVLLSYADFLASNPGNLTDLEIQKALGAPNVRRVRDMFYNGFGDLDFMRDAVESAALSIDDLPHAKGDSGMPTVFWVMTAFATVSIMLRIWSRQLVVMRILTHDWIMVVGFLITLAYDIICLLHAQLLAPNMAIWDISWNTYAKAQAYQTILSLVYPIPLFFIKTSLLLFYLPLCPSYASEFRSVMRTCIFVTFFFILATTVTNFFVILFQCERIAFWDEEVTTYCKFDVRLAQVVMGAFGVVTDIVVWLMPLPLIWRLDLGKREKALAVLTFGLGAAACVVSGFRLRAIMLYNYVVDGKFESVNVNILTVIELNLAIICSSAPAIRALIIHFSPRIINAYSISTAGFTKSSNQAENYDERTLSTQHGEPPMQMQTRGDEEFVTIKLDRQTLQAPLPPPPPQKPMMHVARMEKR
ncbi:hypothetical protein ABW19_dt0206240 [Dactylella cylindrospora]|nr:hypothetical protein ABW19_dt0206240 [Dactylella cylindrospora]